MNDSQHSDMPTEPEAESLDPAAHQLGTIAHDVVNAVSARLDDELIVTCRAWNHNGRVAETARAISYGLLRTGISTNESVPLMIGALLESEVPQSETEHHEELLTEINDIVTALLDDSDPDADHADTPFAYSQGGDRSTSDAAVEHYATGEPLVLAAWCAERRPLLDSAWPPPRNVYVIETTNDADPVTLTAGFHGALAAAGTGVPLIELRRIDAPPNEYQRRIVNDGELIWARQPRVDLQAVDVFDEIVDEIGVFRSDRETIAENERESLTAYLLGASAVIDTDSWVGDVIDSTAGPVVPTTIRTDGTWVWSDATTYYLSKHGIAPAPPFLEHLRSAPASPPPLDSDMMRRARNLASVD